jgi:tight adherence protein B
MDFTILAASCAGVSVLLLTFVIVDFSMYTSKRYKERYLEETAVELDDILLQMPPGKIFDLSIAIAALCGVLSLFIYGMGSKEGSWGMGALLGLIVGIIAFFIPRVYLKYLHRKRMTMFNNQLEDALLSIASSLKAGFSINQALEVIASENKRPISIEFRLLVQEIRLGISLEEALGNMESRLESPDFELVATAIVTARQTGGELTVILERLASVIRERTRINNRLQALTAQGKLQASFIGAMPVLLLLAMSFIAKGMMSKFVHSVTGMVILIGAFVMVTIGFFVIKKITTIDI